MPSRTITVTIEWDDVDDDIYSKLSDISLIANNKISRIINGKSTPLRPYALVAHRLGLDIKAGVVDHIDGNPFNNKRDNLQIVSNAENRRKARRNHNNTSGYRGVTKSGNKWQAGLKITIDKKRKHIYLGTYADKIEAAKAYDAAAKYYFGDFAALNFPDDFRNEGTDVPKTRNENK